MQSKRPNAATRITMPNGVAQQLYNVVHTSAQTIFGIRNVNRDIYHFFSHARRVGTLENAR